MKSEYYNTLLMDHLKGIGYICDPDTYEMIYMTNETMKLCGVEKHEDYVGKKCYKVLQGLDEPCKFCTNHLLEEGKDYKWEHYNKKIGRWMRLIDTFKTIDGRKCRVEVVEDIHLLKEQVAELSDRLVMEDFLLQSVSILTSEKDMDVAVNTFLEMIGNYYNAGRAYIFEINFDNGTMDNTYEWCAGGVSAEIDNLQNIPVEYVDRWMKLCQNKEAFYIPSVSELDKDSDEYHTLSAQGIECLMVAPIINYGNVIGFLGVDDPKDNCEVLMLIKAAADFIIEELEKRRLVKELEHVSYTDMLTGLKNRNQYVRALKKFSKNEPDSIGVVFVDVNGMKDLNDRNGHSYGDYVIKSVATILDEVMQGDVYRIGGDEFIALCDNISKEDFQEQVIELRKAYEHNKDCDVSIGCVWKQGDMDVSKIVTQADELMYAEKQTYYHSALSEGRSTVRAGIATEVLKDIADDRFVVYYQPQVDINTGSIIGAEALVRKLDDDGKIIPPNKFIPFYEVEGVIRHVDLHVLKKACVETRKLMDQGITLRMSVNFSRVTLMEEGIVNTIKAVCDECGVPTHTIAVEVTESLNKMDQQELKNLINELTKAGFTISLDDFGSKYSNLSALSTMDFDEIKFDKTLIDDIEDNQKSRIVIEHSIKMCRAIGDTTSIAEGIESREQLDLLIDFRCDYGQGYYFSKPVCQDDFEVMLVENRKHPDISKW